MSIKTSILTIYFLMSYLAITQNKVETQYMNPEIDRLLKLSQTIQNDIKISTYSIQLKASENPAIIRSIKNQYKLLFPLEIIDEVFETPYFKIIIGAYLDKKMAEKKLKEIQKKFKSAFILKREISVDRFIEYQKNN